MEQPDRCNTRVGSGLTCKQTRLERLARNKHSSLLRKSVNYGRNKFFRTRPRMENRQQPYEKALSAVVMTQAMDSNVNQQGHWPDA